MFLLMFFKLIYDFQVYGEKNPQKKRNYPHLNKVFLCFGQEVKNISSVKLKLNRSYCLLVPTSQFGTHIDF